MGVRAVETITASRMTTSPVKAAVPVKPRDACPQMQTGNTNWQYKLAIQTGSCEQDGVAQHDPLSEMIFIQNNGVID